MINLFMRKNFYCLKKRKKKDFPNGIKEKENFCVTFNSLLSFSFILWKINMIKRLSEMKGKVWDFHSSEIMTDVLVFLTGERDEFAFGAIIEQVKNFEIRRREWLPSSRQSK